jgi:hypothetical protein
VPKELLELRVQPEQVHKEQQVLKEQQVQERKALQELKASLVHKELRVVAAAELS